MKREKNYQLREQLTFKVDCVAEEFVAPETIAELVELVSELKKSAKKWVLLGGGSNSFFLNPFYNGTVVSTSKLNHFSIDGEVANVETGVQIGTLGLELIKNSLSGLEFAGGLPGSIGGCLCMNARAYGREFADVVESVTFLCDRGEIKTLPKKELHYGHKLSLFLENPSYIILSATLRFEKNDKAKIENEWNKNAKDREEKGQFTYPSAGCVFKNCYDLGIPSGKIIDELGFKGVSEGGAKVFEKHANFIVNSGNASGREILKLIERIEEKVLREKGIKLIREVRIIE